MKWMRTTRLSRLICLALSITSLSVARFLFQMSSSGIEDVPPPFILLPGLVGVTLLLVAVVGRYPWRNHP